MDILRKCKYIGHEFENASYICTAKDCNFLQKWCCIKCTTQGIHQHNRMDLTHIKEWKEIMQKKKDEVIGFKSQLKKYLLISRHNLLKEGLQQCKQIFQILKEYQSFIGEQTQNIKKQDIKLSQIIKDLSEDNFLKLDDKRISELLDFNQNQFVNNSHLLMKPLVHINQNLIQLERLISDYKDFWSKTDLYYDIKNVKYSAKQIDQTERSYNTSQISNNEQYLAYGGDDGVLKIYDIKKEEIIKEIMLESQIYACQFTSDSLSLFVGTLRGYVFGYDVLNYQNIIFHQKIHENQVSNIITIFNNFLITCSNGTIIQTDIKTNKQIKITHDENIVSIDYSNNMIIGGSLKKSLILWDCNEQSKIIHKKQSLPQQVRQLQFINKNQNLLSLDSENNLYKWKIDLINKDLIKIKKIADGIYNFYQINLDQILILICKKQVKISDNQGNIINSIDHLAGDFDSWINDSRQLETGRFIQVRSKTYVAFCINLKEIIT